MKSKILRFVAATLFLSFMGTGCEDNDHDLWEISPESKNVVIQQEMDGIEFNFCLLNEDGEPATVFNEGENFTFNFSFGNKKQNTVVVTTEFISPNFYRVYSSKDNIDMGKPWTGLWCELSLAPHEIKLAPSEYKELSSPWMLTENNEPTYPLCMSGSNEFLPKGYYYTRFDLDFHYTMNDKEYVIDSTTFKITFEIK